MTALRNSGMVLDRARELAKRRMPVVAVAGGEDPHVAEAVAAACDNGIVTAVLVGDEKKIHAAAGDIISLRETIRVEHAPHAGAAMAQAVKLCSEGKAQILMKGKVPTPDLMKAVLAPQAGLKQGKVLSHCAVLEIQGYPKLISVTDGGVLVKPDLSQRINQFENAVWVSCKTGVPEPKVAFLGVADEEDSEISSSVEAAETAKACRKLGLTPFVEGPLTWATAFNGFPEGSKRKSDVAGDPDILVSHSIEECNISVKALIQFRGTVFMGVIAGAKVPLSLVSRTDPPRIKLASLALAAVLAGEDA